MSQYPLEEQYFIESINKLWGIYMKHGPRSSEKTKYFHGFVQKYLEENVFKKLNGYEVFIERCVESYNLTGKKQCDIVVYKDGSLFLVMPIKMIMTNYKQNKSNYFENLCGEMMHLVLKNPCLKIVPLNIYFTDTPYLTASKKITKFEKITFEKDLKNYDILKNCMVCLKGEECKPLVYDIINYIFDVEHSCKQGELFDKIPVNINFNVHTPYRSFESIFEGIV
jgi:hypothetical protein